MREVIEGNVRIRYTESLDEVFALLKQCGQTPVYESIGKDENGADIALPCFTAN